MASNAIVTVVMVDNRGVAAFSSGFVSSVDGKVITCYHAVEGATRVSIYYKLGVYKATVLSISPERDLAILKMNGAPLPTSFLHLSYKLPADLTGHNLRVEGYAAGLFDQMIKAAPTQDSFEMSENMRGEEGERLFALSGVKVLPLNLTIYKGMSGAPLITQDGRVLGIVSGSLNQGGSIAWAIAAENAQPQFMTSVDEPISTFNWPKLKLMASGWQTLRSVSGIGADLVDKIELVTATVNDNENALHQLCLDHKMRQQLFLRYIAALEQYPELAGSQLATLQESDSLKAATREFNLQMRSTIPTLKNLLASAESAQDRLKPETDELQNAAFSFEAGLPSTPRNTEIERFFNVEFSRRRTQQMIFTAENIQTKNALNAETDDILRQTPKVTLSGGSTLQDAIDYLKKGRDLDQEYGQSYCSRLPFEYAETKDAIIEFRLLLTADVLSIRRH